MNRAIVITEAADGIHTEVSAVDDADLPEGDVTVDIDYSTVNYKDALAMVRGKPVVQQFPMVPGIDFAGKVVASTSPDWRVGDEVVLNGWGVGERRWGGLAQRARVEGSWLIARPEPMSARDTMVIGTAGFTSMLCVRALEERGVEPADGPVLVTGATGGVGSFAVTLLAALGFDVIVATGKPEAEAYLRQLGAKEIIDRTELGTDVRPLSKQRWAAAIDTVGSSVLAGVLSATKYGGTVAACGNAAGMDLPSSVAPFILRAVSLIGVDSVSTPTAIRVDAWRRLGELVSREHLDAVAHPIGLADAIPAASQLLESDMTGRVVVDVRA